MKCGAMGDVAATSFYANKLITTGEGGMVLTQNPRYADRAREYRNLCFDPHKRFLHTDIGYNFRMTNLQAAVGLAQLEQIERFIAMKKQLATWYGKHLAMIEGIRFMIVKPWADSVYWMFCVELDPDREMPAAEMMDRLNKYGIGTRPFFLGLHAQPALRGRGLFKSGAYPKTEVASRYGFYVPSGLALNEHNVTRIAEAIKLSLEK
jgi:perosamine synthetase